jgi:hypothetical protein
LCIVDDIFYLLRITGFAFSALGKKTMVLMLLY